MQNEMICDCGHHKNKHNKEDDWFASEYVPDWTFCKVKGCDCKTFEHKCKCGHARYLHQDRKKVHQGQIVYSKCKHASFNRADCECKQYIPQTENRGRT